MCQSYGGILFPFFRSVNHIISIQDDAPIYGKFEFKSLEMFCWRGQISVGIIPLIMIILSCFTVPDLPPM